MTDSITSYVDYKLKLDNSIIELLELYSISFDELKEIVKDYKPEEFIKDYSLIIPLGEHYSFIHEHKNSLDKKEIKQYIIIHDFKYLVGNYEKLETPISIAQITNIKIPSKIIKIEISFFNYVSVPPDLIKQSLHIFKSDFGRPSYLIVDNIYDSYMGLVIKNSVFNSLLNIEIEDYKMPPREKGYIEGLVEKTGA